MSTFTTILRSGTLLAAVSLLSAAASAQNTHIVRVGAGGANAFEPKDLIVGEGDTVTWEWEAGFHNVNAAASGAFLSGSPTLPPMTFSVTFDAAFLAANPVASDLYDYVCDVHVGFGMVGSVQVLGSRTLSATATAGANGVITVTGGNPNGTIIIAYSLAGNGPLSTQWGTASITPPFTQMAPMSLDPGGDLNLVVPVPAAAAGATVHMQGLELLGGGAGILTRAVTFIVQ